MYDHNHFKCSNSCAHAASCLAAASLALAHSRPLCEKPLPPTLPCSVPPGLARTSTAFDRLAVLDMQAPFVPLPGVWYPDFGVGVPRCPFAGVWPGTAPPPPPPVTHQMAHLSVQIPPGMPADWVRRLSSVCMSSAMNPVDLCKHLHVQVKHLVCPI